MTKTDIVELAPFSTGHDERRTLLRRRRRMQAMLDRLVAPALAVILLAAWQVLVPAFGISAFVLPTPLAILERVATDFPMLLDHMRFTAAEVLGGFALAILVGVLLALAIFYSRLVEHAVYPILIALQTVPKVTLAPLIVIYLGYGWGPKIFLSFLVSFFSIVVSTVVALKALDRGYVNLIRSMGGTEAQIFFKVRLPAALPALFGSLKVALTLSIIGAIIGEYVASERGLGYLQLKANSTFDTTLNFASVVMTSLLGVSLYFIINTLERMFTTPRPSNK